jgi:NDP-mannose synthase
MELYKALTKSINGGETQSRAQRGACYRDDYLKSTRAVVLAGGRGTRLAPYTSVLPKPLMPIGDRAILEIVVEQLEAHGVKDITFCVGYLSHLIRTVFDNRANGHVNISYAQEEGLLGTAGPLRLVDGLEQSFIVMNGDVLTTLDYWE